MYADVAGWESFEPWLGRVESLKPEIVWQIAEAVPPAWYGGDLREMERLVTALLARRARVREWIVQFRESGRRPFPKWVEGAAGKAEGEFGETERVENEGWVQ